MQVKSLGGNMCSSSGKVSLLFVLMWALLIQTTGCGNANASSLTDDTMIRSAPPTVEISQPIETEIYEPDIYPFPADADVLAYYASKSHGCEKYFKVNCL